MYIKCFGYGLCFMTLSVMGIFEDDLWAQSQEAQDLTPLLEVQRKAVRNGSLTSTQLALSLDRERAIGWFYYYNDPESRFCTGTVISYNAVLTAKHCFVGDQVDRPEGAPMGFAIPSDELVMTGELIPDAKFPFTTQDVLLSDDHDIAIVRFADMSFQRSGLIPIPINSEPLENDLAVNLMNSTVEVAGYGQTYHDGEQGRYFAAVKLELITPQFLMVNGQHEQGVCRGDSGGPLLAAGVDGEVSVFGVVSNGDRCCVGVDQLVRTDIEADNLVRYADAYTSSTTDYPSACWGVSRRNRCEGSILQSCGGSAIIEVDCRERGLTCGYISADARFGCTDRGACSQPQGYCLNESELIRCEYGEERVIECVNAICGLIDGGDRPACISPVENPPCDDDNIERLIEASQARFRAEPRCQTGGDMRWWAALLILWLSLRYSLARSKPTDIDQI